jgi:hypothetical protein
LTNSSLDLESSFDVTSNNEKRLTVRKKRTSSRSKTNFSKLTDREKIIRFRRMAIKIKKLKAYLRN